MGAETATEPPLVMLIYQEISSIFMKVGIEYQHTWRGPRIAPHQHVPEGMDGWAAQATLRMEFMRTMELEKQLKSLFSERSGLSQTRKTEMFSRLLDGYEDSMGALGTLSKDDLAEIRGTHTSLVAKYFAAPTKENYIEFIAGLKPTALLINGATTGWIGQRGEPLWSDAPSLHTLWNMLHQFQLADVCLYKAIGTKLSGSITLVGQRDEHVDFLVEIINKHYTPVRELEAPTILVNERPGVVTIILRDVGKGDAEHSGMVTVNFNEKNFDFTLALMPLDEKNLTVQAQDIQRVLAKAGIPSNINSDATSPIFLIGQGEPSRRKLAKLLNTSRTQWKDLPGTQKWLMDSIRTMTLTGGHEHHHDKPHEHAPESSQGPGLRS